MGYTNMNSFFKDDDGLTPEEWVTVVDVESQGMEYSLNNKDKEPDKTDGIDQASYDELLKKYEGTHKKALFEYCYKHNIGYVTKLTRNLLTTPGPLDLPRVYLEAKKKSTFAELTFFEQIRQENFEKIYSEDYSVSLLDEEDKKNRLQVIEILGYDPFKDDAPEDQPQLYRDMTGMLTEAMRKDVAKARAALSVVRGYSNIDKYQRKINEITRSGAIDEETQKQLDQYIKLQKTMQDSINTTAEKNNFTVKGLGNGGKGMLSDVMNQIEEKGIDEGIPNFYDIATSKSIEEVANISFKAQLNQISLSKTDYVDILTGQCELTRKSQKVASDALEALRLAKEKITKEELLDELAEDYRKKGISEKEIEEFVNRELNMYDGSE